jgi:hypothetical protein
MRSKRCKAKKKKKKIPVKAMAMDCPTVVVVAPFDWDFPFLTASGEKRVGKSTTVNYSLRPFSSLSNHRQSLVSKGVERE